MLCSIHSIGMCVRGCWTQCCSHPKQAVIVTSPEKRQRKQLSLRQQHLMLPWRSWHDWKEKQLFLYNIFDILLTFKSIQDWILNPLLMLSHTHGVTRDIRLLNMSRSIRFCGLKFSGIGLQPKVSPFSSSQSLSYLHIVRAKFESRITLNSP